MLEEAERVQQMLDIGIIRPSNNPWASPVVMVRKNDGKLRFCVDFRQLNFATVKDVHPLLDTLQSTWCFSTLNLKSGHWQVPLQEADKHKMAFRTSNGQLYELNQVPFSFCNAPATFSWHMDCILTRLIWEKCLLHLDDIIVISKTWKEHLWRLEGVFKCLCKAKVKLGA